MARLSVKRFVEEDKTKVQYELYDFQKKYGGKGPELAEQSEEFDEKLALVLDKMRKEGKPEHKEMIARSIQMFDDILEGNDVSENTEQCLLLARVMEAEAGFHAAFAAFVGFLGVATLVTVIVLADPVMLVL